MQQALFALYSAGRRPAMVRPRKWAAHGTPPHHIHCKKPQRPSLLFLGGWGLTCCSNKQTNKAGSFAQTF